MNEPRQNLQMPLCCGVDIEELSIRQIQSHFAKRSFTSVDLTKCYLERIRNVNTAIKAVIEVNEDAEIIAGRLDAEREGDALRSDIHGIPFLVKDNIATKDNMETTAGSAALMGTVVSNDAAVVARLRAAGGILLGKANLSEWASMRASYYAEAYSSRGGQNRNPYNLAEHPGGSSSGSASALAANMCAFSIGTETDGSVMFPADRNAVVGIKPTVGLTSTSGVIPEAPSLDTVGAFGRSVEDATIVLDVIAEPRSPMCDRREAGVSVGTGISSTTESYISSLAGKNALKGATFGLPMARVWNAAKENKKHAIAYSALLALTKQIEAMGARVIEVDFPSAEEIISPDGWDWTYAAGTPNSPLSEFEVVKVEFYENLAKYLIALEDNKGITKLEDIRDYNIQHTEKEGGVPGTHPAWPIGQDNFDRCIESKNCEKSKALAYIRLKSREEGIDAALLHGGNQLDGLLVPLQADGGVACSVAAKAGYPMISIPVGVNDDGVPFGLGIIQKAWKEDSLIKFGSAIEDLVGRRHRPTFMNLDADNYPYVGGPA